MSDRPDLLKLFGHSATCHICGDEFASMSVDSLVDVLRLHHAAHVRNGEADDE